MSMSREQLRQLGIAATAAARHQRALGRLSAATLPPDMRSASASAQNEFWRHQQVAEATQRVCSFRDMVQEEYNVVMQHFEALAGPDYQSRATHRTVRTIENAACHRLPGCEYVRQMNDWLAQAGYKPGYAIVIMQGKFRGTTDIRLLSERQLKELHDTVVNRCRAKLGLGDPDSRNKKQRAQRAGQLPPETAPAPKPAVPPAPLPPPTPAQGSAPDAPRSRTYILRPRHAPRPSRAVDPENEPF